MHQGCLLSMSEFSIEWLDLRESADYRARDRTLIELAISWLKDVSSPNQTPLIADLGSGTGSTIRSFDILIPDDSKSVSWRLVDHDPILLSEAKRRLEVSNTIEVCLADLSDIQKLPLEGVNLVTSSALLDLVSAHFVSELAQKITHGHQPVGLYSALNYDGTTSWTPSHPLDKPILNTFNQDQRRDKGFGPALGPNAARCLENEFGAIGFEIFSAKSPWLLEPFNHKLTSSLIDGIADVALRRDEIENFDIQEWRAFRKQNIRTGTCRVGHIDLLALPRELS